MEIEGGKSSMVNDWGYPGLFSAGYEYLTDALQRAILFTDILRKRGNVYLKHQREGLPPVLIFDFEMVVDGRTLERPVNYAIVKIVDSKKGTAKAKSSLGDTNTELRPIVVIDPRAGHGPGIGGSKLDSQIGVAVEAGHPVYFVMFFPDPEPGQTMADVQRAEVQFLEEVMRLHPNSEPPAVIGNCQAGWATALIGADRPDVTGPMVFNGSPLSYWGGVEGANPMRYKGGLYGGAWLTSLWCDLGNGKFDGAHLVSGFEDLNPANTLWQKQYNIWANVDTEEERYLNFEKWWGGFFKMNREEIHFIVDSLFVGNELEQGTLRLEEDRWVNLKNFKDPIVVFASKGDNITPPQQALNWIYKVYKTVDEIKRNGQVIVYIIHQKIGHLGIFVGSKVARKEHSAIIGTVDMIEYLSPGLYEMVITDGEEGFEDSRTVEFVEREMEDILQLDDGFDDEVAFGAVSAFSRFNDTMYLTYVSPSVRAVINETTAEAIRQIHPLRMQRYLVSDNNPLFWGCKMIAPTVKEYRKHVQPDNLFLKWEKYYAEAVVASLNNFQYHRDQLFGFLFKSMYENHAVKTLFPEQKKADVVDARFHYPHFDGREKELWLETMKQGGNEAAIIRIVLLVSSADKSIDQREFLEILRVIEDNDKLKRLEPGEIKRLLKEQAAMVDYDKDAAITTLTHLLPGKAERINAYDVANGIARADRVVDAREEIILERIRTTLELEPLAN